MQVIHTAADLRSALQGETRSAFVPTMGNLHAGHVSLVELARQHGGPVVSSIFVNPLQFGVGEDFERYPRTLVADCAQLEAAGCDLVFAPALEELYPEVQTFSVSPPLAEELCGAFRPGHFAGVCSVVLKLFNLVQPRFAAFGKKDYQQLFLLKGLVRQFNLPIVMLEGETLRAADGLALSSRNGYLSPAERSEAPRLIAALREIAAQIEAGAQDLGTLEAAATQALTRHGWRVDYIAIRSRATLLTPTPGEAELVILGAAHLGSTRLIDNLETLRPV